MAGNTGRNPFPFLDGIKSKIYVGGSEADRKRKQIRMLEAIKEDKAQSLRGVIVEVTSKRQAQMAANAGASCVLVTCRPTPGDVTPMPDPAVVIEIKQSVKIPVMVRVRAGHFAEAQILESIGVDYIDESEVLSPADEDHFINKESFRTPFICGCRDFGEKLRRMEEGASLIRIQGDMTGSGDIRETVANVRRVMAEYRLLERMEPDEVFDFSYRIQASYSLVDLIKNYVRFPVRNFAAGGIITPADAVLMTKLGCHGVFVGLEVFDHVNPIRWIAAIVRAVTHVDSDPAVLAEVTTGLVNEDLMLGIDPEDAQFPADHGDH